jgi:hypothetical protein
MLQSSPEMAEYKDFSPLKDVSGTSSHHRDDTSEDQQAVVTSMMYFQRTTQCSHIATNKGTSIIC